MSRFAPALLLALFGAWCGTFAGGATAAGSAVAAASLLGVLLWLGSPWQDPLRLGGTAASLLPLALWAAVAASQWASPVPRAGRIGIVLLPAFLWLPGAVERCWFLEVDRREGGRAISSVTGAIALWALVDAVLGGDWRAAMPLGHHNLLAAWLVILLPLAFLPAREPGRWRWLGWGSGAAAALAILASRSFLGSAALFVEGVALVFLLWRRQRSKAWRRGWAFGIVVLALIAATQLPRAMRILTGEDSSAQARMVYYQAGWDGLRERPFLGWGPGSAAWTAAAFLRPRPGVNPWGEVVGELHSLPVQLAYETGAVGLALALALGGIFFGKRLAGLRQAADPPLLVAGLLGLLGGAVAALGSGALVVTALPLAAAVAAGSCLAALPLRASREMSLPVRAYAVLAGLALLPLVLAQWHYDRAVEAASVPEQARTELAQAMRLDPEHPLYRLRFALLQGKTPRERAAAAQLARQAAEKGDGVAALWLIAGILGQAAGDPPWTEAALARACALDPLNGLPPFFLAASHPKAPDAARHGAHALLAEPRLAAAVFWEDRGPLLARSLDEVRRWPGVDAGWKEALIAAVGDPSIRRGDTGWLRLEVDAVSGLSLSLHAFRRRSWPAGWPLVEVGLEPAQRLTLPPATALPATAGSAFPPGICATGKGPSLHLTKP